MDILWWSHTHKKTFNWPQRAAKAAAATHMSVRFHPKQLTMFDFTYRQIFHSVDDIITIQISFIRLNGPSKCVTRKMKIKFQGCRQWMSHLFLCTIKREFLMSTFIEQKITLNTLQHFILIQFSGFCAYVLCVCVCGIVFLGCEVCAFFDYRFYHIFFRLITNF